MDQVTAFTRRQDSTPAAANPTTDSDRTLAVTATYLLSEEGRKASLLAGGDGRAIQQLTVQVPSHRLHLVTVDANGIAMLKLRPRYELAEEERVIRVDAPPSYDAPPNVEDLFREAARNHQLERTYYTERRSEKARRRDTERDRRTTLGQAFLSDPAQRAVVHPAPTPSRCWLATEHGRVMFDVHMDEPGAREVAIEAHRRFRADLRIKREQNLRQRGEQLALHEQKKNWIAEWVAVHGTADQQARQAAGVFSLDEGVDALTDSTFNALADRKRYQYDGIERLREYFHSRGIGDMVVLREDLVVTSTDAKSMDTTQWQAAREIQRLLPAASVTLRMHKLTWRRDPKVSLTPVFGILITQKVGPFTLRREYAL